MIHSRCTWFITKRIHTIKKSDPHVPSNHGTFSSYISIAFLLGATTPSILINPKSTLPIAPPSTKETQPYPSPHPHPQKENQEAPTNPRPEYPNPIHPVSKSPSHNTSRNLTLSPPPSRAVYRVHSKQRSSFLKKTPLE